VTVAARRAAVAQARKIAGISERRACRLTGFNRASCRYQSLRGPDSLIRERARAIAVDNSRWGYRKVHRILKREGLVKNRKKTERIYREEMLKVPRRRRKRLTRDRQPLPVPTQPNERWSMDFVMDAFSNGRRFRNLTVVDDFSRDSVGIEVDTSISGQRVARMLEAIGTVRGLPKRIVVDNGPEFTSEALDIWASQVGVELHFIDAGKPNQNAFIESFNGIFRNECLNENWFIDLRDAREKIAEWRQKYNAYRPHGSLNDRTPEEFLDDWARSQTTPEGRKLSE
jgi:putative transposase